MTNVTAHLSALLADRYLIEREIGAGGMATVFLARDLKHDRFVALKVLRPEIGALLGIERFLAEIRVTAHLQHPHILPLFDSGNADGLVWYAMPFIEGESLREKLTREKQLSAEETIAIASGVAAALDYAHKREVIHRDIKPENILLQDGQPVVADFGIALALSAAAGNRLTVTGVSLGTPQYMSPEQATNERIVDRRTDVYSLGSVVYEMFAGDPPFSGSTVQSVLAQVAADRPRRLSVLRDSVPAHVEAAVFKALAKAPADRFASAGEFVKALSNPGSVALGAGVMPQATARRVARAWSIGRSAALLAAGALTGALAPRMWPKGSEGIRSAVQPVTRFAFDVGRLALANRSVAVSPDGSLIAYVVEDSQQATQILLRALDRTDASVVAGTRNAVAPFFSPDGTRLGFFQEGKLKSVSVNGGEISILCEVAGTDVTGSWGAHGNIVFTSSWRGHTSIFQVPAVGGEPELLLTPDSIAGPDDVVHFTRPQVLPDGKNILFVRWSTFGGWLAVLSVDSRRVTELSQRGEAPYFVDPGYVVFFDGAFKIRRFDIRRTRFAGAAQPFAPGARSQLASDYHTLGVSRSGTAAFLACCASGRELVLVDRLGREEVVPVAPDFFGNPRFSPDGRRIAVVVAYPFTNAGDIWIYDTKQHTLARLTTDSVSIGPEWTPDGRRIIYASKEGHPTTDWNLRWIPADNSGPSRSLLARASSQWQGLLTPGGRTLVYQEWSSGTRNDIWAMPVDTPAAARPLARSTAIESGIALSPDGNWLAYHSNESGRQEVYVRRVNGSGSRHMISRGGRQARWGPGSRELYFRNGDSVYVVSISASSEIAIGPVRPLMAARFASGGYSSGTGYDVRFDGESFVFVRDRADDRHRIEVIVNWFDHLRSSR